MNDEALTWLLLTFGVFAVAATMILLVFWAGALLAIIGLGLLCVWETKR